MCKSPISIDVIVTPLSVSKPFIDVVVSHRKELSTPDSNNDSSAENLCEPTLKSKVNNKLFLKNKNYQNLPAVEFE